MNFYALGALINGISSSALGILVYFKNRKGPVNIYYGLTTICIGLWSYGYFFWQIANNEYSALFWCRVLMAGAIFIPPIYMHFVLALLGLHEQKKRIIFPAYILGSIFFLLNFTPLFVNSVSPKLYFEYWPNAGITYLPFLFFYAFCVIYAILIMFKEQKRSSGIKRAQIKYVILGAFLGFGGGLTNYPLWYDINILPIGNIMVSFGIAVMAYAIVKYRLMDIKIAITRAVIFLFVYGVTFGVPGIVAGVGKALFYNILGDRWWFVPLGLFIGMISTAPYIYFRLRRKAEDWIFRDQREYEKVFRDAPRRWIEITDPNNLYSMITDLVSRYMRVSHCSLFVKEEDREELVLKATCKTEGIYIPNRLGLDNPLVQWFISERDRLVKKGIFKTKYVDLLMSGDLDYWLKNETLLLKEKGLRELVNGMKRSQDELKTIISIPCYYKKDLIALITLGEKLSRKMYNDLDLEILNTLASEVALVVKNSQLAETMTQQKILVNLGQMAIYIAHDLNSPLGNVKTFHFLLLEQLKRIVQGAPPKIFRYHDMIKNEIERMGGLIRNLLLYTRPTKPILESIHTNQFIEDVLEELASNLEKKRIRVIKKYGEHLPSVRADRNQMMRVFVNLVVNAIDAMAEEGQLGIKTDSNGEFLEIAISDTGKGIAPHIMQNVFKPFVTFGKKGGSGLGLAIVDQFVKAHKGEINIDSKEGKGTTFTIKFPLEKREFARIETGVNVQRIPSDEVLSTRNISTEGICFSINQSVPVGEYLRVLMILPTHTSPLEAIVKVAWLRESSSEGSLYDIGVEIIDISEDDSKHLRDYIRNQKARESQTI